MKTSRPAHRLAHIRPVRLIALTFLFSLTLLAPTPAAERPPNFIVIFIDDMSYSLR